MQISFPRRPVDFLPALPQKKQALYHRSLLLKKTIREIYGNAGPSSSA